MALWAFRSKRGKSTANILSVGNSLEVIWPNAGRNVTQMIPFETIGSSPQEKEMRRDVVMTITIAKLTIPSAIFARGPDPAVTQMWGKGRDGAVFVDLGPKRCLSSFSCERFHHILRIGLSTRSIGVAT